jgi:hypothetical protein
MRGKNHSASGKKLLLVACIALASCINVKDFGIYWDRGIVDKQLIGSWLPETDTSSECIMFTQGKGELIFTTDDRDEPAVRTLMMGRHTFMMMRRPVSKSGELYKYTASKESLELYQLNKDKRDEFLKEHATPNIVINDDTNVTISTLDKPTFDLLQKIANDGSYWVLMTRYLPSKCTPVRDN